jgi:hypothetical protein
LELDVGQALPVLLMGLGDEVCYDGLLLRRQGAERRRVAHERHHAAELPSGALLVNIPDPGLQVRKKRGEHLGGVVLGQKLELVDVVFESFALHLSLGIVGAFELVEGTKIHLE